MSLQRVKIACLQYDHTMPLVEGAVKIEGVDAAFETATILEANSQMVALRHRCETPCYRNICSILLRAGARKEVAIGR